MASSSKAAPAKRRSPAQIAADAQAAYRASVAAKHAQAVKRSDHHASKADTLRLTAATHDAIAERFETQADALAAELARLDAAAKVLTEGAQP